MDEHVGVTPSTMLCQALGSRAEAELRDMQIGKVAGRGPGESHRSGVELGLEGEVGCLRCRDASSQACIWRQMNSPFCLEHPEGQ